MLKLPLYMESSNYLVEYIPNWWKCLCIKKVTGETFEVRIFCANVHKGNVKRAPSSPIMGHLGQAIAHLLFFIFKSDRVGRAQFWADTKNSSRSCRTGRPFGTWVARIIFWQPAGLSVMALDSHTTLMSTTYKMIFLTKSAHKMVGSFFFSC